MTSAELLVDAFGRIREVVHRVVDGLTSEQLALRLDPEANSIAWLVWHLTRIQDDHLADVAGVEQVWTSQGSACRWAPGSRWLATTTRPTSRPPGTWEGSATPISIASWTGPGIRRCHWARGWSA